MARNSGDGKKDASYRSAKTGQYVTAKHAKAHPSTTVKEAKPGGSKPSTKSK